MGSAVQAAPQTAAPPPHRPKRHADQRPAGGFDVTLTSQTPVSVLDPTVPPQAAFVSLVTGQTEFQNQSGDTLSGVNAAAADFNPEGDGNLTDLIAFTGGLGDLSSTPDHIVVGGHLVDPVNGMIEARYSGDLYTPNGDYPRRSPASASPIRAPYRCHPRNLIRILWREEPSGKYRRLFLELKKLLG